MEHTPGPWEAKRLVSNSGEPYATHYEAHIDLGVCMVWAPPGNEEQEANARLIAAAPDLLAACEAFVELFCDSDMRPEDECHDLYAQCQEAITKARGVEV